MHITKYAHACLLVEKEGVKVLVDPGSWNTLPDATGLSAILITHEHMDHYDPAQVKALLETSPNAQVITHPGLSEKLAADGIKNVVVIEPKTPILVDGLAIESFGTEHAAVYKTSPCRNTGYLIGEELFVPGDALHDVPNKKVRVLALPTGGPWMKFEEAVDYAKKVKPTVAFNIHDAMYTEDYNGFILDYLSRLVEGVEFVNMPAGSSRDF
jgi:L-ascorbate metabolism protein UlaG (beta-lactamase superfamily)